MWFGLFDCGMDSDSKRSGIFGPTGKSEGQYVSNCPMCVSGDLAHYSVHESCCFRIFIPKILGSEASTLARHTS